MRLNFSVPVFALLLGAGLGYCFAPRGDASGREDASPAESAKSDAKLIKDASGDSTVEALRARIKELEQKLEEGGAVQPPAAIPRHQPMERASGPARRSPREMMEELRKNDPERFAQMTNNMARWRQARAERAQEKLDFLSSIDVHGMGRQERRSHERLERMIAQREELEEAIHNPDLSDEERHELMREMFDTDRQIRELNSTVRANLIAETIKELGYTGDDADLISKTLSDIISATDSSHQGPPHGMRPPRD